MSCLFWIWEAVSVARDEEVGEVTAEQWRPVVGYEGVYEVSDRGRVQSVERVIPYTTGWGTDGLRRQPAKVLAGTIRGGYVEVGLKYRGSARIRKVHRLVLEAFVGPCPPGQETRHKDGRSDNNDLSNLAWGTPGENADDRVRHGTHVKTRITHCPLNHELSGANLDPAQLRKDRRSCRACRLARGRRRFGDPTPMNQLADELFDQLASGWRPSRGGTRKGWKAVAA